MRLKIRKNEPKSPRALFLFLLLSPRAFFWAVAALRLVCRLLLTLVLLSGKFLSSWKLNHEVVRRRVARLGTAGRNILVDCLPPARRRSDNDRHVSDARHGNARSVVSSPSRRLYLTTPFPPSTPPAADSVAPPPPSSLPPVAAATDAPLPTRPLPSSRAYRRSERFSTSSSNARSLRSASRVMTRCTRAHIESYRGTYHP